MLPLRPFAVLATLLLPAANALTQAAPVTAPVAACVARLDGYIRIVSTLAACDKTLETPIQWNAPGPHGPSGPIGPIGSQGPIGLHGPAGTQGATGPAGPTGIFGTQGTQGPTGPIGPTGPRGQSGPQGLIGAVGPIGPQGDPGPAGATGSPGAVGPIGPAGFSLPHIIPVPTTSDIFANAKALYAAITSITDASDQNRYQILLDAGTFEWSFLYKVIILPQYVSLRGSPGGLTQLDGDLQLIGNSTLDNLTLNTPLSAPALIGSTTISNSNVAASFSVTVGGQGARLTISGSMVYDLAVSSSTASPVNLFLASDFMTGPMELIPLGPGSTYACVNVISQAFNSPPFTDRAGVTCSTHHPNPYF